MIPLLPLLCCYFNGSLCCSVEEMFRELGVGSLSELLDAYQTTASKVLSLWGKQAEQEGEVERLESEIRSIQALAPFS